MLSFLKRLAHYFFLTPPKSKKDYARQSKDMREHLTERQIDKALADSFPASDPPAWY